MSVKVPIRTVFDGDGNATGLAEYQSGEFIGLTHGGLGASLTLGTANQILKVNSGATALEFGNVESIFNIDGLTDGTGITIGDTDQFAISDGTVEKRINASQITSYVQSNISSLDAASIADGSVSDTEFQHLNGVTSAIQTQIDTKAEKSFAIAQAIALG